MIYKMTLKDSVDTMTFNLLETPIVDKDIEGAVDNVTLDGNQYTDYLYLKKQYIQKWAIMCPDEYDELRGFYTRQFEEGEVPSYRVYYGANVTRDYTFNGDYFRFNAEGIETGMTLSQLTGNAEQTTYSGKNLLYATELPKTQSNVTATYQDGIFGLSGTSSIATNLYVLPHTQSVVHLEAGESVTMYIERVSGTSKVYFTGYFEPDDASATDYDWGLTLESGASTVKRVRTASKAGNLTHVQMFIHANTTYNSTVKILVQKGNIANPTWEPYVGGIPAPNPSYPQPISTVTGEQSIEVVGKNLLNIDFTSTTTMGITITNNGDGTITVSGTTTGAAGFNLSPSATNQDNPLTLAPNTAYTQRIEILSGTSNFSVVPAFKDSGGTVHYNFFTNNQTTTTTDTMTCSYYNIYWGAAGRVINATFRVWLERGSDLASPYEPYHGQSYDVNLGGKNLFDAEYYATATYTSGAYKYTATDFEGGKTYTFSATLKAGKTAMSGAYVCISDAANPNSTQNFMTPVYNGAPTVAHITASFASNATIYFQFYPTTLDIEQIFDTYDFQLEEGSVRTPYQPFVPYHYELCKVGDYQDRIYKDDGKWYIEKQIGKVVFDGTENWTAGIGGTLRLFYSAQYSDVLSSNQRQDFLSNNFHFIASGNETGAGFIYQQRFYFYYGDMNTDATAFKTWLSTHPTTVYYALETPTTTEITDETLLSQLNFLASLYKGENNISLVGTGAQGEMEVFIRDVMSVETDVVPEVPVRLTLTDDGVINACGCRRNVQLTMRETTE